MRLWQPRIAICENEFRDLVAGKAVRRVTLTGAIIDIVLDNVTFDMMLRAIEHANRRMGEQLAAE